MMRSHSLDISTELYVFRHANGVKLIEPSAKSKKHINNGRFTQHSISSLLKLSFSIYFDNSDGIIQLLNEHNAQLCGFDSPAQAIGQTYFNRFSSKTAHSLLQNDTEVMKKNSIQIFEENIKSKNNHSAHHVLSLKCPWYGNDNKVIGLFGCSVIFGKDSFASALTEIAKIGLLNSTESFFSDNSSNSENIYLSKQQRLCADYLLKGMTVKEIARRMDLSPRTVESYINDLKSKFLCSNKTELILKLSTLKDLRVS